MGIKLRIHIQKGTDIGGDHVGRVNPFVVVCFDEHLDDEMYKTNSANTPQVSTSSNSREHIWDETFTIDFTHEMKNAIANGYKEPTYITFNVFDSDNPGLPNLGSAGVMISKIRDEGFAAGDFPIVNGTGFLTLSVGDPPKHPWISSPVAKKAGIATAAGAAVLAIGLTARHYRNKKKTQNQQQQINRPPSSGRYDQGGSSTGGGGGGSFPPGPSSTY